MIRNILIMFNKLNKQEVWKSSGPMTLTYAKVDSHTDGTEIATMSWNNN